MPMPAQGSPIMYPIKNKSETKFGEEAYWHLGTIALLYICIYIYIYIYIHILPIVVGYAVTMT